MDITALISPILQLGLPAVLLLVFIKYFFDKDKSREAQIGELYGQIEKREALLIADMTRREEQYKERERIITAENAQREEILRKEADKREKILREEAEKRETALLFAIDGFGKNIDSFGKSIDKFDKTLKDISSAMGQLQQRIEDINGRFEK